MARGTGKGHRATTEGDAERRWLSGGYPGSAKLRFARPCGRAGMEPKDGGLNRGVCLRGSFAPEWRAEASPRDPRTVTEVLAASRREHDPWPPAPGAEAAETRRPPRR